MTGTLVAGAHESVASRGIAALLWGALGSGLRICLQLIAQIALARLVGAEQYGVFATALIALAVSAYFADIGLAYGLIQKTSVSETDIRFVLTWQVILGLLASLLLFLSAGLISDFFSNPAVEPVVQVLALACLINALTAPSMNLLKRDLRFRELQLAGLTSYALAYVVIGLGLALAGAGVWALAAAFLANSCISLVLMYRAARHPIGFALWPSGARNMATYGGTVLLTNLVNWLVSSIDRLIVGRMFSTTAVGYYGNAYNLISNPALTLAGILQPALFSASARVQGDLTQLRQALLAALAAVFVFVMPAFLAVAVLAEEIVLALYGAAWAESGRLLRPMACAMPFLVLISLSTPTLWVTGKVRHEFMLQLPLAILSLIGFITASQISLLAMAWALFFILLLRAGIIVGASLKCLEIKLPAVRQAVQGGILLSLASVAAAEIAMRACTAADMHGLLALCLSLLGAALTCLLLVFACPRLLHPTLYRLLHLLGARLPAMARDPINRLLRRAGQ